MFAVCHWLKLAEFPIIVILSDKDEVGEYGREHEAICNAHYHSSNDVDLDRIERMTGCSSALVCVLCACVSACVSAGVCVLV